MPLTMNQLAVQLIQAKEPRKIRVIVNLFDLHLATFSKNRSIEAKCTVILSLLIRDIDSSQAERLSQIGMKYMSPEDKQDEMVSGVSNENRVISLAWMVANQHYDLANHIISEHQYLLGYLLDFKPFENMIEFFEYLSAQNENFLTIINQHNEQRITLLHMAVFANKLELVRLCLRHGADLHEIDRDGESVIELAIKLDNPEMIKLIIQSHLIREGSIEYDMDLCRSAIRRGKLEELKQIVGFYQSNGKPFLNEPVEDTTLLMMAIRDTVKLEKLDERIGVIKYLLACGAKLDVIDSAGRDVLFQAAIDNTIHSLVAELLLQHYFSGTLEDNYLAELFVTCCECESLFLAGEICRRMTNPDFFQQVIDISVTHMIEPKIIAGIIRDTIEYSNLNLEQVELAKQALNQPIFAEEKPEIKKSKKQKGRKNSKISGSAKPKLDVNQHVEVCRVDEGKAESVASTFVASERRDFQPLSDEFIQLIDDLMLTDQLVCEKLRVLLACSELTNDELDHFEKTFLRPYKLFATSGGELDIAKLFSCVARRRNERQLKFQTKVIGVVEECATLFSNINSGLDRQLAMNELNRLLQAIPKTTYAYHLFYSLVCEKYNLQDACTELSHDEQCFVVLQNKISSVYTRMNREKFYTTYIPGSYNRWFNQQREKERSNSAPQLLTTPLVKQQVVRAGSSQGRLSTMFFRPISPTLSKDESCSSVKSTETIKIIKTKQEKIVEGVYIYLDPTASKILAMTGEAQSQCEIEGKDLTLQDYLMRKTLLRQRDMLNSPKQRSGDAEFPKFQGRLELDPNLFEMRLYIDNQEFCCLRKDAIPLDGMVYYPNLAMK